MSLFIKKSLLFSSLVLLLFMVGISLPPTPRASEYLVFAKDQKDSLLKNSVSPRIVFIGGSNLSFGLNSKIIKDSLGVNPVNAAISGYLGLKYMLGTSQDYIQKGDIVVVVPEYQLYFGRNCYGGDDLMRTVFEAAPNTINKLGVNELINISTFLPKFAFSRFNPMEYLYPEVYLPYSKQSFNSYGDVSVHWDMYERGCSTYKPIDENFNPDAIAELKSFEKIITDKGANMFISFPALQSSSFDVFKEQINEVDNELRKNDFALLGTPERYEFQDSLIFNAPYHLCKQGADIRTNFLIEELKGAIANN